eukprot:SAG22_NODE_19213_length_277_cov_0.584270_1_plen_67_part_01
MLGSLHGPFDNSVRHVQKDVGIPFGVDTCTVSWRSYIFGSFDDNHDHMSVEINGKHVWEAPTSNIWP